MLQFIFVGYVWSVYHGVKLYRLSKKERVETGKGYGEVGNESGVEMTELYEDTETHYVVDQDGYTGLKLLSNSFKHVRGKQVYENGSEYDGQWKDNLRHGTGVYYDVETDTKYEGEWKQGKKDGHGAMIMADGSRIAGEWSNDELVSHRGVEELKNGHYVARNGEAT